MRKLINLKNLKPKKKYIADYVLMAMLIVATTVTVTKFAQVQNKGEVIQVSNTKKKLPIYSVDTEDKKVSISFDAAWGADDTDKLLEILAANDVKATFFLCGYWVTDYPEEVKKIHEAGHEIGNHGDNHAHGASLNLEQNKQEIQGVTDKINALIGVTPTLFRPPFGEYNDTVLTAAEQLNYHTIQWDVETHVIKLQVLQTLILKQTHINFTTHKQNRL